MAEDLGSLIAVIGADIRDLKQGVRQSERELEGYRKKTNKELSSVDKAWSKSGKLIVGTAGAIGVGIGAIELVQFSKDVIQAGVALDSLERSFKAIFRTTEVANMQLQFVNDTAKELGLSLPVLEDSYKNIAAAAKNTALEGAQVQKIFRAITETSAVLGMSAEDTQGALRALSQMISKGNVQAEELRGQLGERLPGAFQLAARAMGVTTQELNKMLEQGQVLAVDLLPKLADVITEDYGKAAIEAGKSARAAFVGLDNAVLELKRTLAESGITEYFAELAREATDAVRALDNLIKRTDASRIQSLRAELEALRETEAGGVTGYQFKGNRQAMQDYIKQVREQGGLQKTQIANARAVGAVTEEMQKKAAEGVSDLRKQRIKAIQDEIVYLEDKRRIEELARMESVAKQQAADKQREQSLVKQKDDFTKLIQLAELYQDKSRRPIDDEQVKMVKQMMSERIELEKDLTVKIKENTLDQFQFREWQLNEEVKLLKKKYKENAAVLDLIEEYYKTTYEQIEEDRKTFQEKEKEKSKDMFTEMREDIKDWGDDWASTMWQAMKTSDDAFTAIKDSFIDMLGEMILQKGVTEPIMGGLFGDGGGGGFLGGLFSGGLGDGNFDPFNLIGGGGKGMFFDGGGIATAQGKKPLPAIVHEGEMIGTAEQMAGIFGGKDKGQSFNINIMAMDSESFVEFTKRNPSAIIEPMQDALENNGAIKNIIKETTQ